MEEKHSFFAVRFDHETGTFDLGGELIEGMMGGCMLVVDDDKDEATWRFPSTNTELELDAKAERALYLAIEKLKIDVGVEYCDECGEQKETRMVDIDGTNLVEKLVCPQCG